jgi:hypothetical protein
MRNSTVEEDILLVVVWDGGMTAFFVLLCVMLL